MVVLLISHPRSLNEPLLSNDDEDHNNNFTFFLLQASFETPWFTTGSGCNMSFFYHMSDRRQTRNNMGTLLVEVKTVDKTWFAVFWKAGDQGNQWHQGQVDLSVRNS